MRHETFGSTAQQYAINLMNRRGNPGDTSAKESEPAVAGRREKQIDRLVYPLGFAVFSKME